MFGMPRDSHGKQLNHEGGCLSEHESFHQRAHALPQVEIRHHAATLKREQYSVPDIQFNSISLSDDDAPSLKSIRTSTNHMHCADSSEKTELNWRRKAYGSRLKNRKKLELVSRQAALLGVG